MSGSDSTPATSSPPPLQGSARVLLTLALSIVAFMEVLDMTIVNVSLWNIAGSLAVSPTEAAWTISSYGLAAAILQPLTGWLGRRYGEIRTFTTCVLLFTAFSALCGMATSMPMLIAARLLQGLVSGPMVALSQALMIRLYPPEKRGTAITIFAMVIILAPIAGPIMGGWITDNFSWPWLFYINVPIGVLAWLLVRHLLRGRETEMVNLPVDYLGLLLLVVGVGCLQYMLDNGNDKDWFNSTEILIIGIVSVVALVYLIIWELGAAHPVLELHLLSNRNFVASLAITCTYFFVFTGQNILLPLWMQTNLGYTATWAGLALAPPGIVSMFLSPFLGTNSRRLNLRWALTAGLLGFGLSTYWMSLMNDQASFGNLTAPRFLQGIFMPLLWIPINIVAFSTISPQNMAAAIGFNNFARTMAGSLSTATSLLIWTHRTEFHHATLTEHVTNDAPGWMATQNTLAEAGLQQAQTQYAYTDNLINLQSVTLATNDVYFLFSVALICIVPMVWLLRPPFFKGAGGNPGAH